MLANSENSVNLFDENSLEQEIIRMQHIQLL